MIKKLFSLLFVALILVSCTGTKEQGTSTLLFVAYKDGANNKLALIEDLFFKDGASNQRLRFLKDLSLPAKAIDYDIKDRFGERSEMIVLSGESGKYYLSFFNLKINPDKLSDFHKTNADIEISKFADNLPLNASKIQISKNAKYVSIMNNFDLESADDAIDIFDITDRAAPKHLKRLSSSIIAEALFMPQSNRARLYYLTETVSAVLNYIDIPGLENTKTKIKIPNSQSIEREVKDMGQVEKQLVVLQNKQITPIKNFLSTPELGDKITTGSSPIKLIPNNSPNLANLVVISNNKLIVHQDLQDNVPNDMSVSLSNGSVEPFGGFVYFVNQNKNRAINIFDLQSYNGNPDARVSSNFEGFSVFDGDKRKELPETGFITWSKAFVPLETK